MFLFSLSQFGILFLVSDIIIHRWVTILRAQWQQTPPGGGPHKFVIANMKRFLDIYTENGDQLAQLGGESISAVPAVAQFHPTQDWVAGGTGSGKLALFM